MFAVVKDSDAVVLVGVEDIGSVVVSSELQPERRKAASKGAASAAVRVERYMVWREVGRAFPVRVVGFMGETVAGGADRGAGFVLQRGSLCNIEREIGSIFAVICRKLVREERFGEYGGDYLPLRRARN